MNLQEQQQRLRALVEEAVALKDAMNADTFAALISRDQSIAEIEVTSSELLSAAVFIEDLVEHLHDIHFALIESWDKKVPVIEAHHAIKTVLAKMGFVIDK
jgi:hypothetical protein